MQMQAKMKTVEEQHADYQKHIAVLKESLIAKEEHYNMLQLDVSLLISDLFSISQLLPSIPKMTFNDCHLPYLISGDCVFSMTNLGCNHAAQIRI